ncbi:MAG: polyprenyl synthetase family protein [Thermodesulfobacteriota bacterium]
MSDVFAFIQAELPRVNGFLERQAAALDPVVRPVVEHALLAGGKRLRPMLVLLAARALQAPAHMDPYPLACSLELLHTATLLHDDILDGADLRRGRQTAHLVFGDQEAILAGDVLLALANRLVAEYGDPRLTWVLSEAIMRTATGEVMEIGATRKPDLGLDRYMDIITGKTAYLFQGACQCGAILAGAEEELEDAALQFGLHLGVAFQLVDDSLDYTARPDAFGKPEAGDLREGKVTMPLLLYLEQMVPAERAAFSAKFAAGTLDEAEIASHLARIRAEGHPERTRQAAHDHAAKAAAALSAFPQGPEAALLSQILDFVLSRSN